MTSNDSHAQGAMKQRSLAARRQGWRYAVPRLRRWWWAAMIAVAVLAAIGTGIVLSLWVRDSAADLLAQANALVDPKDRAAALKDASQYQIDNQIKIWTGLVQAAGVVALVVGGFVGWRNLRATQDKLDIDRDGQITNRITQAVAQLGAELHDGKPNLAVRLGGIYALERIAKDSPRDHWSIMEILTAYVRENAPWTPPSGGEEPVAEPPPLKPRIDIQAILTILGRRKVPKDWPEPSRLDLSSVDLRGATFARAHLERADLSESHLERADLRLAWLDGAIFDGASLQRAILRETRLRTTDFIGADMTEADLTLATAERARFRSARLDRAEFDQIHAEKAEFRNAHLQRASFCDAHLEEATFGGSDLTLADFSGAYLCGTIFGKAQGLTPQQVRSARNKGEDAKYWPELIDADDEGQAEDSPPPDNG